MATDLLCSSSFLPLACATYFSGRNGARPLRALRCSGKATCKATYNSVVFTSLGSRRKVCGVPRSADSSNESNLDSQNDPPEQSDAPFGYSRKDVLLIGLGVMALGVGLKSGLEFIGVDTLQAGNVVQLVLVLGLTIGWISTYIFRVSNKDMTYAKQLRDYEKKVMEKRLEGLTEAELEELLEQVEEEKRGVAGNGPFE